ncbi:MAG: hypothetical protein DHS20C05_15570 [Hyphococcus sp.]|nr:MAG: hypothetical protein DHS20C05_15570 [Marinicaulis sp.]
MFILTLMASTALSNCQADLGNYEVTYLSERQFKIEAQYSEPYTEFHLGHSPTNDRPEAQSESVHNIIAYDVSGGKIDIAYAGNGSWAAPKGAIRISYELSADHDEVLWPHGADEVAHPFGGGYYFTGTAFFIGPDWNANSCPVNISFNTPEGWALTAPWADGPLTGTAKSIEDLQDNGFAIGPFTDSTQRVGNLTLNSLFDPTIEPVVRPYVDKVMDDLLPAFAEYFGGAPSADYTTFHFAYGSSDGSAFARSFTMQYEWPLNTAERLIWAHGLAHETMHLWTGVVERADLENEWFLEGFTDYLAIKHLYREGYYDDYQLRNLLASIVTRHQLGYRLSQGTSLREAGSNKGQNWFLIYGSGALIALMLDAEMSAIEPHAFDDMMATLYQNGKQEYDFERLMSFMDQHSNGRAQEIFDAVDGGLSPNEINAVLNPRGISVAGRMDLSYLSFTGKCRKKNNCAPEFLKKSKK